MNRFFGQAARWMSRRNGKSLAKVLAAEIEEIKNLSPGRSEGEYLRQALEGRPGWRHAGGNRMEFRTGERLEVRAGVPWKELLTQITAIEVKPLGEGLPSEAQRMLIEDAVAAALSWWEKNMRQRV